MFGKNKFLTPTPPSPNPGHYLGDRMKILFDLYVLYLLFVRTHTQVGIKTFEIDFVAEFNYI